MDYKSLSVEELVKKCAKNSDPIAWDEFDRRFKRLIAGAIIGVCRQCSVRPSDVIEDLLQEIYVKLFADNCSLLIRFAPRHENAFIGYLRSTAASVAWDYVRALHAVKRDVANTVGLSEAVHQVRSGYGDPDAVEMTLFFDEVDRLLRQRNGAAKEKERTIFWLHYRQGYTAKEIAAIPAFTLEIKGVESVIHRLTCFVRRSLVFEPHIRAATGK